MKNTNLKKIGVVTLSILLIGILSSCTSQETKTASNSKEMSKSHDNSDISDAKSKMNGKIDDKMMDKEEWTEEEMKEKQGDDMDDEIMDKENMEEKQGNMDDKIMDKGVYLDYSEENLTNAKGDVVLFFHATWCPSCHAVEDTIKSGDLPSGLTILKADYDSSTDLKKKYGVVTQTTFVQIDSNGDLIKKWVGARDIEDIESRIQ